MDLCSRCQAFDIHAFARSHYKYRGYRLRDAIEAADNGCSFCSMLVDNLEMVARGDSLRLLRERKRQLEASFAKSAKWYSREQLWLTLLRMYDMINTTWVHFTAEHTVSNGPSKLGIGALKAFTSISLNDSSDGTCGNYITLLTAADMDTQAFVSGDIVGQLYSESHTSASTYAEAIKLWDKTCLGKHWECSTTMSGVSIDARRVALPSRCLEVIPNNCTQNPNAEPYRFVLRDTLGKSGRYTTLSHRWNPSVWRCRTTTLNVNCRMDLCQAGCLQCHDQPMELTPLFKDAALLSAQIGIKYIWIDSLCIIQDSNEDWRRESVAMASYYQRSWLTFFATALSASGGLFGSIPQEAVPRVARLPYRDAAGHRQGYFYVQCSEEAVPFTDYKDSVSQSELLRRGWVHQEWILSRRKVTFSGAGISFRCQRYGPMTMQGDTILNTAQTEPINSSSGIEMDVAASSAAASSVSDILESWLATVQVFSGLELSKLENDRLIAVAGLAKECGQALLAKDGTGNQPRYVSGLWYGYWRCLLWEQLSDGEKVRVGGFPTWSWASIATKKHSENGVSSLTGMPVQWTSYPPADRPPTCEIGFKTVRAVTVKEPLEGDCETFEPLFDQTSTALPGDMDQFSASNRFHMLGITGKLLSIHLDQVFEPPEDANIAAELTHHSPDSGRDLWRRVATPSEPGYIAGWASLEHPEYQTDSSVWASGIVALVVTSLEGNFLGLPPSFRVLFLRPSDISGFSECYERVGTGGLFGRDVQAMMQSTQESSVWLV